MKITYTERLHKLAQSHSILWDNSERVVIHPENFDFESEARITCAAVAEEVAGTLRMLTEWSEDDIKQHLIDNGLIINT